MGKLETVAKYRDEFLAERTDKQKEAFLNKDVNKQYASIMAWRYKLRNLNLRQNSVRGVAQKFNELRKYIMEIPHLNEEDYAAISREAEAIKGFLADEKVRRLDQEITDLERQKEEIAQRLSVLRNREL